MCCPITKLKLLKMLSDLIKKSILISWKSGVKQSGFNHIKMMLHSVKLVTLKNIVFAVVLEAIYNVQKVIGIKKNTFLRIRCFIYIHTPQQMT